MLRLQRITTNDTNWYNYLEELLTTAFPPEERRPPEEQRLITDRKAHFSSNIILHDERPIGLLTYWTFNDFCYIEHFAIHASSRNGGFGRKALAHFIKQEQLPIVLEVEPPTEEIARRRIAFYARQGFSLWRKPYLQPPYKKGGNYFPLHLMVHGYLNEEASYEHIKKTIYREVYNVAE